MQKEYRTIWLSDIHLGTRGCQADKLSEFLRCHQAETIFLVGDIIDFWALKRKSFWPTAHNTVIQKLLRMARRENTSIFYIPGNHDEALREYIGMCFGDIKVIEDTIYHLADGRKMFCTHGDRFDIITRYHSWVAKLGDVGYHLLLNLNAVHNRIRQILQLESWSLAGFVKNKVKNAVKFISEYEKNVAKEAGQRGVDVVLCGHIHHAEIRQIENVLYINTGDWVESCTAVVEHHNGQLEIITIG